jgi:hypothetical protein
MPVMPCSSRLCASSAPVVHRLPGPVSHVAVARAGVVDADPLAARAAQELVEGLAGGAAPKVPEGDVHGGAAAGLRATADRPEVRRLPQRAGVPLDLQWVTPEQVGGGGLVDVALHRLRAEEGLAESHQAVVGLDADPQQVGELAEPQRVDLDDLHYLENLFSRSVTASMLEASTTSAPVS